MGGMAGVALVGGLMNGFVQGRRQAEEQSVQNEYKKVLMNQAKMNIEMAEQKWNAMKRFQVTKDPMDAMMAGLDVTNLYKGMAYQKEFGGLNGQQPQMPEMNIGMNYEEPTAPQTQITFPASLTGLQQPQPNASGLNTRAIVEKDLYGRPYSGIRSYEDKSIQNGQEIIQQRDAFANPVGQPVINPIKVDWKPTDMPGVEEALDVYGNPTGRFRKGRVEGEIKEVENADKSKSFVFVPKYPSLSLGNTPSQGLPSGTGQFNLDMNSPTIGDDLIRMGTEIKKKGVKGLPGIGGGSGGGIKSTPGQDEMLVPAEKAGDYYNPIEGKFLSEHPDVGSISHGQRQKMGYKEVPKLSGEVAGKFSAAATAIDETFPRLYDGLFPKGKFDKKLFQEIKAVASNWKLLEEAAGGTRGAEYATYLLETAEAWIRVKSGAALSEEDIKQTARNSVGQWLNTEQTVKNRMNLIRTELENFVKVQDPKGVLRALTTRKEQMYGDKPIIRLNGKWFWKVNNGNATDKLY